MSPALSCFCGQPKEERTTREAAPARQRAPGRSGKRSRRPRKRRGMLSRLIEGIVHLVEDDDDYQTASEGGERSPTAAAAEASGGLAERSDSGHLTAGPSGRLSATGGGRRPSSGGGWTAAAGAAGGPAGQQQQQPKRVLQPPGGAVRRQTGGSWEEQRRRTGDSYQDADGGEEDEEEEEEEEEEQRGGWGGILGGVPFLPKIVGLLSPKISTGEEGEDEEEEDGEAEAAGRKAAAGRGGRGGDGGHLQPPTSPGGTSLYPTLAAGEDEAPRAEDEDLQGTTVEPAPLEPGQQPLPELSEPSGLMAEDHIRALAAAVPARYRQARWALLYSTSRDGISLQTLLRNAGRRSPTVLVVRDFDKHVFGAYCSEAWKLDKHFFGTGECFVFQLQPRPLAWFWWWRRMAKEPNDYFQWCSAESIAVGGSGGYALWLDGDLSAGISRNSTTFGNASLAGGEDFRVGAVELWGLS